MYNFLESAIYSSLCFTITQITLTDLASFEKLGMWGVLGLGVYIFRKANDSSIAKIHQLNEDNIKYLKEQLTAVQAECAKTQELNRELTKLLTECQDGDSN